MEEEELRFTIAICSYNIEEYIQRAIESVLNQKFENYELIIVDDCSTDKTLEIIKKFKNEKVKLFTTKTNSGTAAESRNVAIENAQGEYILFLDGDDALYNSEVLNQINKTIKNKNYDIIYLGYESIGKSGTNLRLSNEENSKREARLICDESFSVSSKCWSKKFLLENNLRFKEGIYYEDELFSIKTNILAKNTTFGEYPIFKYYRNREGSVMTKPTIRKASDWFRMLAEVIDLYEITPDEDKKYFLSFIKNETLSLPARVRVVIEALMDEKNIRVLPKRNYKYEDFFDDEQM